VTLFDGSRIALCYVGFCLVWYIMDWFGSICTGLILFDWFCLISISYSSVWIAYSSLCFDLLMFRFCSVYIVYGLVYFGLDCL
jgi:hypothetical protein